ncbi:ParB family protein (plasmid) [Pseudarthrobacter sp. P1]|uniref:ParB family protein n=1 Tax=Pseudarthrobacter sp. P1 TaxID=3418418 RepID=UPI003CEA224F
MAHQRLNNKLSSSNYFRTPDAEQVRAAYDAVGHLEGYGAIADLIEAATHREVRRLQRKYNKGKPWPGIPAGQLPTGRRTAAQERERRN